jgi:hypothetical protein
MALAKFYEKAALAASHVLRGFDEKTFTQKIAAKRVAVYFDESAERSTEGKWTLELTVNLLARLYPKISIISKTGSSIATLSDLARRINPQIEIESICDSSSICLVVGTTAAPPATTAIYIGSDGWIAKVSTKTPMGSANSAVPFGADAAACVGVANVFRATFADQLGDGRLDESWQMSLLDFDPLATEPAKPAIHDVDFKDTYLAGVGAIGNGFTWTLSRMRGLKGELHLIDDQSVDISNLQRYVLARDSDIGRSKVDLAAERLADTGLIVKCHAQTWGKYLAGRDDWRLSRVAVTLDTAKDRQSVQAALPEWIVNAWTQVGDLGVSRHSFLGDQACLACLYLQSHAAKNEDEVVAEAIGMGGELRQVRKMLALNEPVTGEFINRIAQAKGIDVKDLLSFEGQSLRVFYSQAVCGGVLLRLGADSGSQRNVEVPMAFQSALAGIFLAAETVAKGSNLVRSVPAVTTKLDVLRPLGTFLSLPAPKHPSGNCICQDGDYINAYRDKYGTIELSQPKKC